MNKQIRPLFQKFLATGAYCTPPGKAQCALDHARTVLAWRDAESAGLVRLRAEPEQESFADVFGNEIYEREKEFIALWGCWVVIAEVKTPEGWITGDSIGMCVYKDPLDPFQNCYVTDLMDQALKVSLVES